ncbi:S8 family serine peptidase [Halobacterium litoreum]|uniref:S8 family serine peptidase n=1 Tax=Halobacterium litoreum TaxID=2039234 RepID=A0ABD5NFZ9_9EURY|nr:S8 family serine peptidase [Halobacterium litoreum]UHH13075.1 S8 family serine peptidase [Halobacterium litoreum]
MADNTNLTRRSFLGATSAAVGSVAMVGAASGSPGNGEGPDRREYIVGVSGAEDDPEGYVEQFLKGNEEAVKTNDALNATVVGLPENAAEPAHENFVERLERADAVKYVEENVELQAQVAPNDPRYGDQYADQQVNAPEAWDVTFGDSGVTIGVVDQGVKYDHPDLDGNMDGSVSNYGRDFVDDDSDPYPDVLADEYHGTHVAGISAAETDNGEGVTGIGNSSVLSGRALSEQGSGSTADIADAVTWAADQGADVVNLSLGGGGYTDTMKNAVSYATNNGALVVAAAGNDGQGSVSYPAAYSECLAVSALDPDETLASYSNYGSDIELAAPGTNVLSTWTDDGYDKISGTSMATPVVAGVAGLTLAQYDLTNAELRSHLKATAVDVGLSSDQQGSGRVDAGNAVTTTPGSGGGGDDGDGGSGDSTTSTASGTLSSRYDDKCWTYSFSYSSPSEVVIELSGPSTADFDLYANDGTGTCPSTSSYDYRSWTTNSEETITITDPDTSTDLHVLVDSYDGSGDYTLTITEYQ